MKEKIKRLVDLFWQGKLSKEQLKELLSDISNDKGIQEKMNSEFGVSNGDAGLHREEDYERYLQGIHTKMGRDHVSQTKKLMVWKWAAAALVLIACGLVLQLMVDTETILNPVETQSQELTRLDSTYIHNKTDKPQVYRLSDGSHVELQPGSMIGFASDYGIDRREIHLIGEAKYDVVKDTSRPFCVVADGYLTTALGTSFIVNTRISNRVSIKLISGKVVVKSTSVSRYPIEDQYLLPGEEIWVRTDVQAVERRSFMDKTKPEPSAKIPVPEAGDHATGLRDPYLNFIDTPLPLVLEQISKLKNVSFDLAEVDIDNLYFTGEFTEQDDLEQMLSIICEMNQLEYKLADGNSTLITLYKQRTKGNE